MKLTLVLLVVFISAAYGTAVGQTAAPKKAPPQQKQEQPPHRMLSAAFCKFDLAKKTTLVLPWDEKARKWRHDSLKMLAWNDQTLIVSGSTTLTMPQFVGGKPLPGSIALTTKTSNLSETSTDVAGIQGNRGMFYITTIEDKEVIQKVEMVGLFANEPIPAVGGNFEVRILGVPGKVSCSKDDN